MHKLSNACSLVAILALLGAAWVIDHITFEIAWIMDVLTCIQLVAAIGAIYFRAPARSPGRWSAGTWIGVTTLCVAPCVWWYGAIKVVALALAGPVASFAAH